MAVRRLREEGGREEAEGGGKEVRESKIGEVLNKLYR